MILDEIIAQKHKEIAVLKESYKGKDLASLAKCLTSPRNFLQAFTKDKIALIAEIKRASPSSGVLRQGIVPQSLAKAYEEAGASALSVLTDQRYFQGALADLIAAKETTVIPVLRKDFIIDENQVYQARIAGADAVLLIARVLEQSQLIRLLKLTEELGMQALVETHNEAEVERALAAKAGIIGINNRNLDTLQVEVKTTFKLIEKFPQLKDQILVSESGIENREQVQALKQAGVRGILVGTSILKSSDVGAKIRELLG